MKEGKDLSRARIGFIGTGVMGKSMAGHLLDAGYPLVIYNRTRGKAEGLLSRGAEWADSAGECASKCDILFSIVGFPADVEDIYFGKEGILDMGNQGLFCVDMTTTKPGLAKQIYEEAQNRSIYTLDAPVSGGDTGAKKGALSIMAGGDKGVFDTVLPLFELMGSNIVYQGPAGSGQFCKMCNQIAIASNMLGVCESMAYAEAAGLDPATVLESITAGAAGSWSLTNLAPRIIQGDFSPGFYIKHFIKDMVIALESAKEMDLVTPGLETALKLYRELEERGHGNDGTQGLYRLYRRS